MSSPDAATPLEAPMRLAMSTASVPGSSAARWSSSPPEVYGSASTLSGPRGSSASVLPVVGTEREDSAQRGEFSSTRRYAAEPVAMDQEVYLTCKSGEKMASHEVVGVINSPPRPTLDAVGVSAPAASNPVFTPRLSSRDATTLPPPPSLSYPLYPNAGAQLTMMRDGNPPFADYGVAALSAGALVDVVTPRTLRCRACEQVISRDMWRAHQLSELHQRRLKEYAIARGTSGDDDALGPRPRTVVVHCDCEADPPAAPGSAFSTAQRFEKEGLTPSAAKASRGSLGPVPARCSEDRERLRRGSRTQHPSVSPTPSRKLLHHRRQNSWSSASKSASLQSHGGDDSTYSSSSSSSSTSSTVDSACSSSSRSVSSEGTSRGERERDACGERSGDLPSAPTATNKILPKASIGDSAAPAISTGGPAPSCEVSLTAPFGIPPASDVPNAAAGVASLLSSTPLSAPAAPGVHWVVVSPEGRERCHTRDLERHLNTYVYAKEQKLRLKCLRVWYRAMFTKATDPIAAKGVGAGGDGSESCTTAPSSSLPGETLREDGDGSSGENHASASVHAGPIPCLTAELRDAPLTVANEAGLLDKRDAKNRITSASLELRCDSLSPELAKMSTSRGEERVEAPQLQGPRADQEDPCTVMVSADSEDGAPAPFLTTRIKSYAQVCMDTDGYIIPIVDDSGDEGHRGRMGRSLQARELEVMQTEVNWIIKPALHSRCSSSSSESSSESAANSGWRVEASKMAAALAAAAGRGSLLGASFTGRQHRCFSPVPPPHRSHAGDDHFGDASSGESSGQGTAVRRDSDGHNDTPSRYPTPQVPLSIPIPASLASSSTSKDNPLVERHNEEKVEFEKSAPTAIRGDARKHDKTALHTGSVNMEGGADAHRHRQHRLSPKRTVREVIDDNDASGIAGTTVAPHEDAARGDDGHVEEDGSCFVPSLMINSNSTQLQSAKLPLRRSVASATTDIDEALSAATSFPSAQLLSHREKLHASQPHDRRGRLTQAVQHPEDGMLGADRKHAGAGRTFPGTVCPTSSVPVSSSVVHRTDSLMSSSTRSGSRSGSSRSEITELVSRLSAITQQRRCKKFRPSHASAASQHAVEPWDSRPTAAAVSHGDEEAPTNINAAAKPRREEKGTAPPSSLPEESTLVTSMDDILASLSGEPPLTVHTCASGGVQEAPDTRAQEFSQTCLALHVSSTQLKCGTAITPSLQSQEEGGTTCPREKEYEASSTPERGAVEMGSAQHAGSNDDTTAQPRSAAPASHPYNIASLPASDQEGTWGGFFRSPHRRRGASTTADCRRGKSRHAFADSKTSCVVGLSEGECFDLTPPNRSVFMTAALSQVPTGSDVVGSEGPVTAATAVDTRGTGAPSSESAVSTCISSEEARTRSSARRITVASPGENARAKSAETSLHTGETNRTNGVDSAATFAALPPLQHLHRPSCDGPLSLLPATNQSPTVSPAVSTHEAPGFQSGELAAVPTNTSVNSAAHGPHVDPFHATRPDAPSTSQMAPLPSERLAFPQRLADDETVASSATPTPVAMHGHTLVQTTAEVSMMAQSNEPHANTRDASAAAPGTTSENGTTPPPSSQTAEGELGTHFHAPSSSVAFTADVFAEGGATDRVSLQDGFKQGVAPVAAVRKPTEWLGGPTPLWTATPTAIPQHFLEDEVAEPADGLPSLRTPALNARSASYVRDGPPPRSARSRQLFKGHDKNKERVAQPAAIAAPLHPASVNVEASTVAPAATLPSMREFPGRQGSNASGKDCDHIERTPVSLALPRRGESLPSFTPNSEELLHQLQPFSAAQGARLHRPSRTPRRSDGETTSQDSASSSNAEDEGFITIGGNDKGSAPPVQPHEGHVPVSFLESLRGTPLMHGAHRVPVSQPNWTPTGRGPGSSRLVSTAERMPTTHPYCYATLANPRDPSNSVFGMGKRHDVGNETSRASSSSPPAPAPNIGCELHRAIARALDSTKTLSNSPPSCHADTETCVITRDPTADRPLATRDGSASRDDHHPYEAGTSHAVEDFHGPLTHADVGRKEACEERADEGGRRNDSIHSHRCHHHRRHHRNRHRHHNVHDANNRHDPSTTWQCRPRHARRGEEDPLDQGKEREDGVAVAPLFTLANADPLKGPNDAVNWRQRYMDLRDPRRVCREGTALSTMAPFFMGAETHGSSMVPVRRSWTTGAHPHPYDYEGGVGVPHHSLRSVLPHRSPRSLGHSVERRETSGTSQSSSRGHRHSGSGHRHSHRRHHHRRRHHHPSRKSRDSLTSSPMSVPDPQSTSNKDKIATTDSDPYSTNTEKEDHTRSPRRQKGAEVVAEESDGRFAPASVLCSRDKAAAPPTPVRPLEPGIGVRSARSSRDQALLLTTEKVEYTPRGAANGRRETPKISRADCRDAETETPTAGTGAGEDSPRVGDNAAAPMIAKLHDSMSGHGVENLATAEQRGGPPGASPCSGDDTTPSGASGAVPDFEEPEAINTRTEQSLRRCSLPRAASLASDKDVAEAGPLLPKHGDLLYRDVNGRFRRVHEEELPNTSTGAHGAESSPLLQTPMLRAPPQTPLYVVHNPTISASSGAGRGRASAPSLSRRVWLITDPTNPLGCGRLNPYCACCRAKYNLMFVDPQMRPVRWPSPQSAEFDQMGDCRFHSGLVFGGGDSVPIRDAMLAQQRLRAQRIAAWPELPHVDRDHLLVHEEDLDGPLRHLTPPPRGRFVPVAYDEDHRQPHKKVTFRRPAPPVTFAQRGFAFPPTRAARNFSPRAGISRGTSASVQNCAATKTPPMETAPAPLVSGLLHHPPGQEFDDDDGRGHRHHQKRCPSSDTRRSVEVENTLTRTTRELPGDLTRTRPEKRNATVRVACDVTAAPEGEAFDALYREERRIKKALKQLLWHDLPQQRGSKEWEQYLRRLSTSLRGNRNIDPSTASPASSTSDKVSASASEKAMASGPASSNEAMHVPLFSVLGGCITRASLRQVQSDVDSLCEASASIASSGPSLAPKGITSPREPHRGAEPLLRVVEALRMANADGGAVGGSGAGIPHPLVDSSASSSARDALVRALGVSAGSSLYREWIELPRRRIRRVVRHLARTVRARYLNLLNEHDGLAAGEAVDVHVQLYPSSAALQSIVPGPLREARGFCAAVVVRRLSSLREEAAATQRLQERYMQVAAVGQTMATALDFWADVSYGDAPLGALAGYPPLGFEGDSTSLLEHAGTYSSHGDDDGLPGYAIPSSTPSYGSPRRTVGDAGGAAPPVVLLGMNSGGDSRTAATFSVAADSEPAQWVQPPALLLPSETTAEATSLLASATRLSPPPLRLRYKNVGLLATIYVHTSGWAYVGYPQGTSTAPALPHTDASEAKHNGYAAVPSDAPPSMGPTPAPPTCLLPMSSSSGFVRSLLGMS